MTATSLERRMADALRLAGRDLAPGGELVLGMADAATALWTDAYRFDAADPHWPDRDRFVMSPPYGTPLLHGLLRLSGHAGGEVLEAVAGSLGQGLAMAVGMALGERLLAARFGKSLVDHRTWVVATLGDLMEGVSHEAASLAGHLRLEKLTVLLEDDTDCDDCASALAGPGDTARRFVALGWAVRRVDAHDPAALAAALSLSMRAKQPTLIACRTRIGSTWAAPPGAPDLAALAAWAEAGARGGGARRAWLKRLAKHPKRAEFERVLAGRLPEGWGAAMEAAKAARLADRRSVSTRDGAEHLLEALAPGMPELVGGQTQLAPGRLRAVTPGGFSGRQVHYGPREHGMAACANGLALHGGLLPYAVAPLALTDGMRPALRLAAQSGLRTVFVATHDGAGPLQPAEQLAALRTIPNLLVLRPADAVETAECCELAVRRRDGPSVLVLGEHPVPPLRTRAAENRSASGAYVLAEAPARRAATLIASGSEVALALRAREALVADGIPVAVVSMPSWEVFARTEPGWRDAVLGAAPRIGVEAGCGFGWERWLGERGVFVGAGPSLTVQGLAAAVRRVCCAAKPSLGMVGGVR